MAAANAFFVKKTFGTYLLPWDQESHICPVPHAYDCVADPVVAAWADNDEGKAAVEVPDLGPETGAQQDRGCCASGP